MSRRRSRKELKAIHSKYPHRSSKKIKYHDKIGHPMVHLSGTGREYMMVRKSGGGTKRLYEGDMYQPSKNSSDTIKLVL